MIRSLRTGVSGIKSNQIRMDVIGNNVANVNTIAFKRSRVAFAEVLGQQLLGIGRSSGGSGVNPASVGLGVTVASIDRSWAQGALENTGVQTDLALNGDGFFVLQNSREQNFLSRAGNFTFNRNGELVSANGLNVQGWAYDQSDGSLVTGALENIAIDLNSRAPAVATETANAAGNLSTEMALSELQSISTTIYDDQGRAHDMVIQFSKRDNDADSVWDNNEWDFTVSYAGNETDTPFGDGAAAFADIAGTITFDTDGNISAVTQGGAPVTGTALSIDWNPIYTDSATDFSVDLANLTQMSGSTTITFASQDGNPSGTITDYSITPEGILRLSYTNGEQRDLYRLAVGVVNNPNGLDQLAENLFSAPSASGEMQLSVAGRDVSTSIVNGTLELSNVDIATEFTEMIVAQRGYQAAARVITTSDDMLQEMVQLKR